MPFSFVIVSLELELDAVVDELGGDMELDDADELGDVELDGDELDEALELGVDDDVSVLVVEDELLLVGGVAGIDGDVVVELDELDDGGVVVVGSIFCWQPTRASTAAAAAVRMKRFI